MRAHTLALLVHIRAHITITKHGRKKPHKNLSAVFLDLFLCGDFRAQCTRLAISCDSQIINDKRNKNYEMEVIHAHVVVHTCAHSVWYVHLHMRGIYMNILIDVYIRACFVCLLRYWISVLVRTSLWKDCSRKTLLSIQLIMVSCELLRHT